MGKFGRQRKLNTHRRDPTATVVAADAQISAERGAALLAKGDYQQALSAYNAAVTANPAHADAVHGLALVCHALGRGEDALHLMRRAVSLAPTRPELHNNLGTLLTGMRQFEEAIVCHHHALSLNPKFPEAHNNLGNALRSIGRSDLALLSFERAITLKPDFAEAFLNRGNALRSLRRRADALASYHHALLLKPTLAEAHNSLGTAFKELGHWGDALTAYANGLALEPASPLIHYNLGTAYLELGRLDEARRALEFAWAAAPSLAEAALNLGNIAKDQGRLSDAQHYYRQALAQRPDYSIAFSNYLFSLAYVDDISQAEIFAQHREFNQRFTASLVPNIAPHNNFPAPDKRLKVGYLSPDFRGHAVAFFLEPILKNHDRSAVEVFAYAEVANPDQVTQRLQGMVEHWRSTVGLSDEEVAAEIRADGIDIVIDLAGHTARNRMLALARKPAPVQVTYLGYPATTGLDVMDYRITDAVTEPAGTCEQYYTEKLIRLSDSLWCYQPFADMPEVSPLPVLERDYITFGSFNNFAKIGPRVIDLWARVLHAVPNAKLSMLCAADAETQEGVSAQFASLGIAPERLILYGRESRQAYLARFAGVDIALDPFPCNGGTTTCDALWMGVPVIALIGNTFLSRASYSVLKAAGLSQFAVETETDYIQACVAVAANRERLAQMRYTMREHMLKSTLLDGPQLARNLEAIFRAIWRTWCEGQQS